jgi:putative transposase
VQAKTTFGLSPRKPQETTYKHDDARARRSNLTCSPELSSRLLGYRRLHLLLEREGVSVNWKKLYRLRNG